MKNIIAIQTHIADSLQNGQAVIELTEFPNTLNTSEF